MSISPLSHECYMPHYSHLSRSDNFNSIMAKVHATKLHVMQIPATSHYFVSLGFMYRIAGCIFYIAS